MNGKVIIFLSIIIIIISSVGIFINSPMQNTDKVVEEPILQNIEVMILTRDVKRGEKISEQDIKLEQREVHVNYLKDSFIIDKPLEYSLGSVALRDLGERTTLRYDDIQLSDADLDYALEITNEKDLPFSFPLREREYAMLRNIKSGSLVDVYFRYEIRAQSKEDTIVLKRSENSTQQSRESANLTNLVLLFSDKRVLNIKGTDNINSSGRITLQMDPNEIKSVYAIENLGGFYIFPTQEDKNNFSTKNILSKDFIKELRGGEK